MDAITGITGWTFLQEPIWRWFLFLGAVMAMTVAWKDIIEWIK